MTTLDLPPCPDKPNCVSTLAETADSTHYIEPMRFTQTVDQVRTALMTTLADLKGWKLVKEEGKDLHYTFTSGFFRFVDDIQFSFDEKSKTLHFRSASRVGYSDLGVNRKRMEGVRKAMEKFLSHEAKYQIQF